MSKQHLSIFAIVAVSLMTGMSALMVDAEKPEVVNEVNSQDICGADICESNINIHEICGETDSVLYFEYLEITYSYGKDKFKTVESITGEYKVGGNVIGTIDESTTTIGHSDKGATVKQFHATVHCTDGTNEPDHDVTVTRPSKD